MRRWVYLTAMVSSALTVLAMWAMGWAKLPTQVKLENTKVRVSEVTFPPGVPRTRGIRAHDQVIVFMDACRYQRIDPDTGQKTVRTRKAGDVIWHNKGEAAPQLTNLGSSPYHTMVIELK